MAQPLSVGRLVRVSINLQPLAAARRGFGTLLVAGSSNVIDGQERLRTYTGLEAIAADLGANSPEYLAAALYLGQSPRPSTIMIGRWLETASAGFLRGGILTTAEQVLGNFTAVTNGYMNITIDGVVVNLTAMNFSSALNLNAVAQIVTTELAGAGTCTWDGSRFRVISATTGVASSVSYATAGATGTPVQDLFKLSATLANAPVPGFAAEQPVDAVLAFANMSGAWYGLMFADTSVSDTQHKAVSELVEGLTLSRIYGITITNTNVLDGTVTNDIASELVELNRRRTATMYSPNPYAIAALFGRAFSVNFSANRSTITLMYKQMPGVVPELLTETQALTLKDKRVNVFAAYDNDTAILQYGVMSGQAYFDEMHGLDWFQNALQTAEYNLLYQSKTKIPQTDDGANQIVAVANGVCGEAVNNGLVAPGQWNADGFGQISRGDYLSSGFYIFMPPMATQDQSIREQRIAPPMQIGLKLAGAIHELDILVDVNR